MRAAIAGYEASDHQRIMPRWAPRFFLVLTVVAGLVAAWSAAQAGGWHAGVFALLELPIAIPAAFSRELAAGRWATAAVLGTHLAMALWLASAWYWRVHRMLLARKAGRDQHQRPN